MVSILAACSGVVTLQKGSFGEPKLAQPRISLGGCFADEVVDISCRFSTRRSSIFLSKEAAIARKKDVKLSTELAEARNKATD